MKTWFVLLPITALLLGGAVGCEPEYDQNARTNIGEDGLATDDDTMDMDGDEVAEGRIGDTRRDLGAEMGTADDDAGLDAEAGANPGANPGMNRPAPGVAPGAGAGTGAMAGQRQMSGTLEVQDETARTFQLDGDGATYVAPSTADLDDLDGEEVTIMLDANGRVTAVTAAADDQDS